MPQEQWKLQSNFVPWYVAWSSKFCDKSVIDTLKQYYEVPIFLPKGSHDGNQEWIFMGTSGVSYHQDKTSDSSWQTWQAQV